MALYVSEGSRWLDLASADVVQAASPASFSTALFYSRPESSGDHPRVGRNHRPRALDLDDDAPRLRGPWLCRLSRNETRRASCGLRAEPQSRLKSRPP